MLWEEFFINLAYVIFLVALVVKDMLWLRIIMTIASFSFIAYAFLVDSLSMKMWNGIFTGINIFQIIRLLLEMRKVELSPILQEVYDDCFSNMTRRDFLNFWYFGRERTFQDRQLCEEGRSPLHLMYMLNGRAEVTRNGKPALNIGKLNFIAEMSFLSNEPASANVTLKGKALMRVWSRERLEALEKMKPELIQKLRISISRDLSQKLQGETN